ncbi:MAG TPA: hypothetical protein VEC38_15210 [Candidatus Binataceae bacterium]|nr:hypothetical protein [Candidatus Binataceae bacterium]
MASRLSKRVSQSATTGNQTQYSVSPLRPAAPSPRIVGLPLGGAPPLIALRGVGALASWTNTTTTSATGNLPGGLQTGDVIIAFLAVDLAPGTITIPAGWTLIGSTGLTTNSGGSNTEQFAYYYVCGSTSPSTTWSWANNTPYGWLQLIAYSGVSNGSPVDQYGTTTGGSSSYVSSLAAASLTPSQGGDQLLISWSYNNGSGSASGASVSGAPAVTNEWSDINIGGAQAVSYGSDLNISGTGATTAYSLAISGGGSGCMSSIALLLAPALFLDSWQPNPLAGPLRTGYRHSRERASRAAVRFYMRNWIGDYGFAALSSAVGPPPGDAVSATSKVTLAQSVSSQVKALAASATSAVKLALSRAIVTSAQAIAGSAAVRLATSGATAISSRAVSAMRSVKLGASRTIALAAPAASATTAAVSLGTSRAIAVASVAASAGATLRLALSRTIATSMQAIAGSSVVRLAALAAIPVSSLAASAARSAKLALSGAIALARPAVTAPAAAVGVAASRAIAVASLAVASATVALKITASKLIAVAARPVASASSAVGIIESRVIALGGHAVSASFSAFFFAAAGLRTAAQALAARAATAIAISAAIQVAAITNTIVSVVTSLTKRLRMLLGLVRPVVAAQLGKARSPVVVTLDRVTPTILANLAAPRATVLCILGQAEVVS